jgi:hypothetical protein
MKRGLLAVRQAGIGKDPLPLIGQGAVDLTRDTFLKNFKDQEVAHQLFVDLQGVQERQSSAVSKYDEFVRQFPEIPQDKYAEYEALRRERHLLGRMFEDFLLKVLLQTRGLNIDDGTLMRNLWESRNNDLHRGAINAGRITLSPPGRDTVTNVLRKTSAALCLVLKSVPLPAQMEVQEFTEFRNSTVVRSSLRSFRKLAQEIVQGQAASRNIGQFAKLVEDVISGQTRHIADQIKAAYDDYKNEIRRRNVATVQIDVKFIVSNMGRLRRVVPDLAESIIRGRVKDHLVNGPFEVGEHPIDQDLRNKGFEASPFYFFITPSA